MPNKDLRYLVTIIAAVWAVAMLIGGIGTPAGMWRLFSTVTGSVGVLLLVFETYLWRLPFLHPWLVAVPNLRGVWKTEIRSNWVNPETNQGIAPIKAYMVVRQTYSGVSMRLITKESTSKLMASTILREQDGLYAVIGVYCNEPKHSVRDRSPIHYGSLVLHVVGQPVSTLGGHYWTDRGTQGELYLSKCKNLFPQDFESAAKAFGSETPAAATPSS
jgi:SMODS-associating 2TM, beta-strand rich effector domain